jgi:hypothetical protein
MNDPSKQYSLVYQVGIANVFDPKGKRLRQADYRSCEMFCYGLIAAGMTVDVFHCDVASDCFDSKATWHKGPGDLWRENKHPPTR